MPFVPPPLRRLFNKAQSRFNTTRPGSVLILVIALLVLLALIGTAYISGTRTERYASEQNVVNTQIEMLMQGLVNLVTGGTSFDLKGVTESSGGLQYRPPAEIEVNSPSNVPAGSVIYNHFTSASSDLFLADRYPTAGPYWGSVSWPLQSPDGTNYNFDFLDPTGVAVVPKINLGAIANKKDGTYQYIPGFVTVGGQVMPALAIKQVASAVYLAPNGATQATPYYFLAADADGDGIADSGLWKLPFGQLDGVTYYAAIRVVDNNAALNVNTAVSNASDFNAKGTGPVDGTNTSTAPGTIENLGMFPSHVGLMQVLSDYNTGTFSSADMNSALVHLFNGKSANPLTDNTLALNNVYIDTAPRTPARTDVSFLTAGDNLASQLARRLSNPGYFSATDRYQPFTLSDSAALAYRFCLRHSQGAASQLETSMPTSMVTQASAVSPYSPAQIANWFNANFNYTAPPMPARSLVVASNPVSDFAPAHYVVNGTLKEPLNPWMLPYNPPAYDTSGATTYLPGSFVSFQAGGALQCFQAINSIATAPIANTGLADTTNWRQQPWSPTPTKACINTATFAGLWRAFYNIMADSGDAVAPAVGTTTPVTTGTAGTGIFRNSSRAATILTENEMLQLRSAIAAVNAMDMRDSDDDITSRTIQIYSDDAHTNRAFDVTVFGCEKQLFITLVVANMQAGMPTQLSIELYNPTNAPIDVNGWVVGFIDKSATPVTAITNVQPIAITSTLIPANGYLLLQSNAATNVTPGVKETPVPIPNLEQAAIPTPTTATPPFPQEVVILRPRRADGTLTSSIVFDNIYKEAQAGGIPDPMQMVPVDMIDLFGVFKAGDTGQRVYERPYGTVNEWKFVYPGTYALTPAAGFPRQTGWGPLVVPPNPAITGGTGASDGTTFGGANPDVFPPIQLATGGWVGPNSATTAIDNLFPFGAFARNGDMLKVPFIGSYVIRLANTPTSFVEMNSITMDASQADAQVLVAEQADEPIGRFCPMASLFPAKTAYTTGINPDPYGWASKFFDYLDVQVADDDCLPNVDPAPAEPGSLYTWKYPAAVTASPVTLATSVQNGTGPANSSAEQSIGKQGLININTAPAYILQTLPGVSATMATAIVNDRQTNGPFTSIFQLNRVGATTGTGVFQTREGNIAANPGVAEGDFTPDTVSGDFEEKMLMLTRISNLITTRSDSFTCYLLIQGWRGIGTSSPTLAVQRRTAFILDRTPVTPTNTSAKTFPVATN